MPKTNSQIARDDRERTAKWRASRTKRKVPEARQIDKAVLTAFLQIGRQGPVFLITAESMNRIFPLAFRLLVRAGCDEEETKKAVRARLKALSSKSILEDLDTWESFIECCRLREEDVRAAAAETTGTSRRDPLPTPDTPVTPTDGVTHGVTKPTLLEADRQPGRTHGIAAGSPIPSASSYSGSESDRHARTQEPSRPGGRDPRASSCERADVD